MFTTKFPSYKVNPICIFKCTEYINGRNSCVRNVVIWKELSFHGKWVGIQKQSPQVERFGLYSYFGGSLYSYNGVHLFAQRSVKSSVTTGCTSYLYLSVANYTTNTLSVCSCTYIFML